MATSDAPRDLACGIYLRFSGDASDVTEDDISAAFAPFGALVEVRSSARGRGRCRCRRHTGLAPPTWLRCALLATGLSVAGCFPTLVNTA